MANNIEEFKKEVKKVVKDQYKKKEIDKQVKELKKNGINYCGETAQMLADSCTDILYGWGKLGTQEEWDILEEEINKYLPPED